MKLKNEREKSDFLKELESHLERFRKQLRSTDHPDSLSVKKYAILEAIYQNVDAVDITTQHVDLEVIYRDIKNRYQGTKISDAELKARGSFDRRSDANAVMKAHRDVLILTDKPSPYLTFLLNLMKLMKPVPKSAKFLRKTGFFDVELEEHPKNSKTNSIGNPKSS